MTPAFYDAAAVEQLLDPLGCIEAMRRAMIALSIELQPQPLRQIVKLDQGNLFGIMPGDLSTLGAFGAKLVSVFHNPASLGRTRHQGIVAAFNAETGGVTCLADAEAVTRIRTAAATAAATDALARADAKTLGIMGTGTQAEEHLRIVSLVRSFERILVWGRSADRADALARRVGERFGIDVTPVADAEELAGSSDVICTVTGASTPVLRGAWVCPGTHVNLVGSSYLGPVEVDNDLVVVARYIADSTRSVLEQAAEFAAARAAGLISDAHVACEIGEVFAGTCGGRENDDQITIYKSLGNVVQDLGALAYLHSSASGSSG